MIIKTILPHLMEWFGLRPHGEKVLGSILECGLHVLPLSAGFCPRSPCAYCVLCRVHNPQRRHTSHNRPKVLQGSKLLCVPFYSNNALPPAGVPDGRPLHDLPARLAVLAGHLPVGRGHPGGAVRGVHLWDPVLVPWLLLLPGPAHPSARFHPGLLQIAVVQRVRGKHHLNHSDITGKVSHQLSGVVAVVTPWPFWTACRCKMNLTLCLF